MDHDESVQVAETLAASRGIKVTGLISAECKSGAERGRFIPGKASDYWVVTLARSTDIVDQSRLTAQELERLRTFATYQ